MSRFIKQPASEHGQLKIAQAIRSLAGDEYDNKPVLREFSDGEPSREGQTAIANAIRSLAGDTFNGIPKKQRFINNKASEEGQAEIVDAILYLAENGGIGGGEPTLQDKTVTPTNQVQTVTADTGYDGLGTVTVNAAQGGSSELEDAMFYEYSTSTPNAKSVTVTPPSSTKNVCYGFNRVSKITLPGVKAIQSGAFQGWQMGELEIDVPDAEDVDARRLVAVMNLAFAGATSGLNHYQSNIKTVTLGSAGSDKSITITTKAFYYCGINNLYLPGSTVVKLSKVDAFEGVSGLTVHVPSSLLSQYTEATNWSSLAAGTQVTIVGDL